MSCRLEHLSSGPSVSKTWFLESSKISVESGKRDGRSCIFLERSVNLSCFVEGGVMLIIGSEEEEKINALVSLVIYSNSFLDFSDLDFDQGGRGS